MTDPAIERSSARTARPASRPPHSGRTSSMRRTAITPKTGGSGNTPDMSEDESADLSPDEFASPSESAKSSAQAAGRLGSEDAPGAQDAAADAPSMPLQKRRRVTRACDECRRKKIKCDGKQPCTHCSVYSYECTYDKPSNRRRNPAPQYIEALEARLQRAESLLRKFMPEVDLTDPNLDPSVQQEFRNREKARARAAEVKVEGIREQQDDSQDAQIMSMIESIGQLDLREGGEWDYYGMSSGALFLKRMKEHFKDLLGNEYRVPFLPRPALPSGLFSLDSPRSSASSPFDASTVPSVYPLPPLERVRQLCYYSLDCATCLLRVVHQPSFYEKLEKLYATPQDSWSNEERRFLGLVYSILALGCVYNVSPDSSPEAPATYKSAVEEGTKYYTSARLILQDVAECRDMTSLQGFVYMILFLQATSNITDCYAFLGIALRSCLRMGLHRHLSHEKITPIEDQTRRRVFHTIRQLDYYVSAIMGFPLLLHDEDVDQPLPSEVNDEYITKDAILTPPAGTPSFFQAFNAHSRLMEILVKVVKEIYPCKGNAESATGERPNTTFMISYARIEALERELQEWYEQLPIHWRPSSDGPIEVIRVRTLLRFAYAHVQMMLYRPFLHYISPRFAAGKKIDDRYYKCAAAGITISRNLVHIGVEIQKQAVLIGPYWFILYTEFFAIISLLFFVLENPDKPGSAEILADAKEGRDIIASLAQRSLAADRITSALNPLFAQLPELLEKGTRPTPTKKRSAPTPAQGSRAGSVALSGRPGLHDNMPQRRSEEMVRPQPGFLRRGGPRAPPQRTASFDTIGFQHSSLAGQTFTSLHEVLPMNMSLSGQSSESSSTQGTMHRHGQGFQQQGQATGGAAASPLYKLDAMMFPSEDPFAYPNQPIMDPAGHHPARQTSQPGAGQSQDNMQFYMPNMYDGIEGQLMEPIPSYLIQQSQRQPQHGLEATPGLYNPPSMLAMQPEHGGHGHQQPQHQHQQMDQHQHQHQQHHRHHQQHHQPPQQGEMIEDMLTDPNYRGEWDDMLGGTGYR